MSNETVRIDDGGPAFPQDDAAVNRINGTGGMSLRDYFAANMQLDPDEPSPYQAKCLMEEAPPQWPPYDTTTDYEQCRKCLDWWATAQAKLRYLKADAMLAARKAGGK